jgi:chemotaxis protein methyltransferase CheR
MRITDFDVYKDLLREKSGLYLTPEKSTLLESRLSPVAKKWGYISMETMTVALQGVPDKNLVNDVVEAMTTPDTSFFRDAAIFKHLRETALPYFIKKRGNVKKIRIWSAACATGQEPYSIALTVKEKGLPPNWTCDIVGTDISNESIEQGRAGLFSQFEVQRGLSIHTLLKYFEQDANRWKLREDVRKMVKLERFNLLDDMKKMGMFDIIFCRNVLSMFDDDLRRHVLTRLSKHLEKDGFLYLGKSESAVGLSEELKPVKAAPGLHVFRDSLHDGS